MVHYNIPLQDTMAAVRRKNYVVKRDGRTEPVHFDKITTRIESLSFGLNLDHVDPTAIAQKVIQGIYPGVTTKELDELAAREAAAMVVSHPDYGKIAARIAISNLHKQTKKSFSSVMKSLHEFVHPRTNKRAPLISDEIMGVINEHKATIDSALVYNRDYQLTYFGYQTLMRSYLLRMQDGPDSPLRVVECPQHMYMRIALGIHGDNIDAAIETYHLLSKHYFTHASPTMFHAGTPHPQMASCFLLDMDDDSIEGIYDTLKACAIVSKSAGGVGLSVHKIRAKGSYIAGTNGESNGLVPMLRVFNNTARYVDQGGNKRPGAFAIYLEPWHADIFDFISMKRKVEGAKGSGVDETKGLDLFYALWVPDLFWKRAEADADWTLMCPHECPGLDTCWGDAFEALYERYEREGKGRRTIKARELVGHIVETAMNEGVPYILNKDACNCFGRDTLVMMATGETAPVQTLVAGDEIMGPDGSARTIQDGTVVTGTAFMYEIVPARKGWSSWTCTSNHILVLVIDHASYVEPVADRWLVKAWYIRPGNHPGSSVPHDRVVASFDTKREANAYNDTYMTSPIVFECVAADYFGLNADVQQRCKLMRPSQLSYPPRADNLHTIMDEVDELYQTDKSIADIAWILGLWFIDGDVDGPVIRHQANGARIDLGPTVWRLIERLGCVVDNKKKVPNSLLMDSVAVRRKLLAGFIGGLEPTRDGHRGVFEDMHHLTEAMDVDVLARYDVTIISEDQRLVDSIVHLARGLGYVVDYVRPLTPAADGTPCDAYVTTIYKKRSRFAGRCSKFNVASVGDASYYGFGVDGDERFLLGDFTVVHNSKSNQQNLGTIKSSNLCVHGDTLILTEHGYLRIGDFVPETTAPTMTTTDKVGETVPVPATLVDEDDEVKRDPTEATVWTGHGWSKVNVRKTGVDEELMTVTTSFGTRLKCTPSHKFILENGDRVDASALALGAVLAPERWALEPADKGRMTSCVVYAGVPEATMGNPFLTGYVYGYITRTQGTKGAFLGPTVPNVKVPWLIIDKVNTTALKKIGYDASAPVPPNASDTQNLAYFPVPEQHQNKRTAMANSAADRTEWVTGFLSALGQLDAAAGSYDLLYRPWLMLRGTGRDCKLVQMHGDPLRPMWKLKWADPDERPVVIGLERSGERADTYCFTEPEHHAGVFGGQLTGQCSEIIEYTSKDDIAVCLVGDTEIATKDGPRRIDTCDGCDVLVPYASDDDIRVKPHYEVATLINNGVRPVKTITTNVGTITATGTHKFLKVNRHIGRLTYEWTSVTDLKAGDCISAPAVAIDVFLDTGIQFNKDYGVAGWMLGDGWQLEKCYGVCFGPDDTYAQEQVLPVVNKWHQDVPAKPGGTDAPVKTYTQPNGVVNWSTGKSGFAEYMAARFGMTPHKGPFKVMPDTIMRSGHSEIASFLSGLFSADGCVQVSKCPTVNLASSSLELLYSVSLLLRCFGIISTVVWSEVKSRERFQGRVSLYSGDNLAVFRDRIGFCFCPRKQEHLDQLLRSFVYGKKATARPYVIVKDISDGGLQQVYDLALPRGHHFMANGMVVHNCNLASIGLAKFVVQPGNTYDFASLHRVTKVITQNLNNTIDRNMYRLPQMAHSNLQHRPIGIGVQALADTFCMMGLPFDSPEARLLNKQIFETIYHGFLEKSCELAAEHGPYASYEGSPMSQGKLQFDLWSAPKDPAIAKRLLDTAPTDLWDWATLRANIARHGVRNSQGIALPPTASTSQIMNNNECFEPFTSNLFTRKVLSGVFQVVNPHLMTDLIKLDLWDESMRDMLIAARGSVQHIESIPARLKEIYRTAWEIPQKHILEMAADRGAYVDQSQSMNVRLESPEARQVASMYLYGWKLGLKTGQYYLRVRPAVAPIQFTVSAESKAKARAQAAAVTQEALACSIKNKEACMSCSS